MTIYYKVTSKAMTEKLDAWSSRRQAVTNAVFKLSRRCGASRTRIGERSSFGGRDFAFVFTQEPNRKVWKADGEYWLPKHSSKEGKAIAHELSEIMRGDGRVSELSAILGINFFFSPGIEKIGNSYYFAVDKHWPIKTKGLRRISDVGIERARKTLDT